MTSFKEINFGLNQFCGPAVLSALTGKSTDECAAVIGAISGRQEIRAVNIEHLISALERLRFNVEPVKTYFGSLFGSLITLSKADGIYIVLVPRHVVAVEIREKRIFLIDNHTKTAIDASSSARLIQRVERVYKVTARSEPKLLYSEVQVEKRYKTIYLKAIDRYVDERDNVEVNLGYVLARSEDELAKIKERL